MSNTKKITEDGLFYSNFDRVKMPLFLIKGSEYYSEYLVSLRDNYGIKIGKPQPDSNGNIADNIVGVYIVDYERYLSKQSTVLYVFLGEFSNKYFETEKECNDYYEESHDSFASSCIIEYIGNFAGKDDVIKYRNFSGEHYFVVCDELSYYAYKADENKPDIFYWQEENGSIEWMYEAFRDRGIIFKNDLYAQIREEEQKLIKAINQAFKNVF